MMYDKPRFIPSGDEYVLMEIGTDMGIKVNCTIIEFNNRLMNEKTEGRIQGILDTIPCWRSITVYYDNTKISYEGLKEKMSELYNNMGTVSKMKSRIVEIPVMYGTPENGEKWGPDLKNCAELSGLTVDEAVDAHTNCNFWVGLIAFTPGNPFTRPLRKQEPYLKGKIYDSPRPYTPEGFCSAGGLCTAWYTVASSGGYALLGYMPVSAYNPHQLLPDFYEDPILLRAGDRVRYVPIDREQYDEIKQKERENVFRFKITESEFDLKAYLEEDGYNG